MSEGTPDRVDLYWLPLGAGGVVVRWNGRVYEACVARRDRRVARPLYHSALEVWLDGCRYVIEMAPVWNLRVPDRGVVVEGPVGSVSLGRFRAFRYEVRCWRSGSISDVAEAVDSPLRLSGDAKVAAGILALVVDAPTFTWGRDELDAGDMWNSNSLVAWLLSRNGIDAARLRPPRGGRAPGWNAGVDLAAQQMSGRLPYQRAALASACAAPGR
jgi:hypothetical protein